MSSIVTAVFKATIGLLVNKGRDKAAEKLKDGDVTDQKFRGLIVREIDDIKSKLDGLSRKDLLASISFFEEGIEFLYEVFDKARSRNEYGAVTTQAACAEAFSLVKGMGALELTDLDESATRALSYAKKRFEDSRRKATEAFKNEALKTSDRILALQYRVMATILETVDNPADALAPCRVCIKELNSLSAVQNSFDVQLKKGLGTVRGLFSKDERRKVISSVCHVNRVIYDVTQTVGKDAHLWTSPTVDIGEDKQDKVDPLRDQRVTKVLRKEGMEHCCVAPWSFGQEGKEEHKLKDPYCIATNSKGQFIVGDRHGSGCIIKVFDSRGTFVTLFRLPQYDVDTRVYLLDVATDMNDNIYTLANLEWTAGGLVKSVLVVYKVYNTADLLLTFPVSGGKLEGDRKRMTVTDSGKVMLLGDNCVAVPFGTNGHIIRYFGEGTLKNACDITAAKDGRVMVLDKDIDEYWVHTFSEHGDHLKKFRLQGCYFFGIPRIAFHLASEHVIVAGTACSRRSLLEPVPALAFTAAVFATTFHGSISTITGYIAPNCKSQQQADLALRTALSREREQSSERSDIVHVQIYSKDGMFVRSIQIHHEQIVASITVTTEGRIALAGCGKVLVM